MAKSPRNAIFLKRDSKKLKYIDTDTDTDAVKKYTTFFKFINKVPCLR